MNLFLENSVFWVKVLKSSGSQGIEVDAWYFKVLIG